MVVVSVNEAIEKLKAIDRNSYIQKNLLMRHFDKKFHTFLSQKDADDLFFVDILKAPCGADGDVVHHELKEIVKQGVSLEDKQFLYQISDTCLHDTLARDFDVVVESFFRSLGSIICWRKTLDFPARFEDETETNAFYFHREPFLMAEYFVSLPLGIETEAILIKYGCALCLRIVKNLSDVAKLEPLLSMKGNRDFYLRYDKKWRLFLFDV